MLSLVNSHTHATRIGWHLWEIDLRFAPGLPPGWHQHRDPDASAPPCPQAELRRARGGSSSLLSSLELGDTKVYEP